MELLFQIGLSTYQPVEGLFLPYVNSLYLCGLVDFVRGGGLDAAEDFSQLPKRRFAVLVLFFDLRFEQQMDVIRHHTCHIEVILAMIVRVEDALQHDVTFAGRQLALLPGGESDHVFAPRTFKMRQASPGVPRRRPIQRAGADREGAVGCARGGRAPHSIEDSRDLFVGEFNPSVQRLVKRLLLAANDFLHVLFLHADFGKDVAHHVGEHVHEFVEERFVEAERAAVAHGAAQDAAQDVVAVGVAGLDAVGNRKAQRADVVGNDTESNVERDLLCGMGSATVPVALLRVPRNSPGDARTWLH